ncbi:hypothetical protein KEJ32_06075 [Candidatus Bathyarchaeota archaeon]|nr:hypothetical protein [Candidatus Bathyarchaeota archaeon]
MKPLEIAESAVCGALYAVTGYIIYLFLPIVTPGIGIVRFWPNVVVPAVFAVLFGPLVGGLGAAIGIFISDMLIHGDPLLSLSAGVTANFLGFYLLGYISRKNIDWEKLIAVSGAGCLIISLGSLTTVSYIDNLPQEFVNALNLFTAIMTASFIIAIAIGYFLPNWRNYELGSIIGLAVGSTIIGLVVWAYSQIFFLPAAVGGGFKLPFYTAMIWLIWTFATEIPFLILLGPPLLKACQHAFPSLAPQKTESK